MAEFSLPWPDTSVPGPVIGDGQPYTANEWSQVFEAVFAAMASNEGPLPRAWNELAVTTPGANTIRVASGLAMVHGHAYWNTANLDLNPGAAPGGQTRKDRCILRCDWVGGAQYTVRATILTGTQANYPALTQIDDNTWEIPLAKYIINDAGAITDLADERELCHSATMVSTAMIEALAVTTAKIAAGAVTPTEMAAYSKNALQFFIGGDLAVGVDLAAHSMPDNAITHIKAKLIVKDAPTGQALIVDINQNGGSIFAAPNRPQIAAGATSGESVVFAVAGGVQNDLYTIDVDQVGNINPGEDLTVLLWFKQVLIS